jgi:hypothetical protein
VTGCAPDVFLYAPLLRPSVQVEETCPATGTPIRLVFTPSRVERVEPAGAVLPLPGPQSPLYSCVAASNGEQIDADACDASLCSQAPCSPPPGRPGDGSTPTPAAGSSPSGRRGT